MLKCHRGGACRQVACTRARHTVTTLRKCQELARMERITFLCSHGACHPLQPGHRGQATGHVEAKGAMVRKYDETNPPQYLQPPWASASMSDVPLPAAPKPMSPPPPPAQGFRVVAVLPTATATNHRRPSPLPPPQAPSAQFSAMPPSWHIANTRFQVRQAIDACCGRWRQYPKSGETV